MYYKEPTEAAPRDLLPAPRRDYRISGLTGTPTCDYRTSSALEGTGQFHFLDENETHPMGSDAGTSSGEK